MRCPKVACQWAVTAGSLVDEPKLWENSEKICKNSVAVSLNSQCLQSSHQRSVVRPCF